MAPITSAFDTYMTQYPLLANADYGTSKFTPLYKEITDAKGSDWSPINTGVKTHINYGLDIWGERSDVSPFLYDGPGAEGTKETQYSNYGLGVVFTENLIMDGLYNIVENVLADLRTTYDLTRNVQVAQLYDDAFTGSLTAYKPYDGQPLMGAHTSQPGISRRNAPSVAQPLSYTGVQTVLTLMRRFKSLRGRPGPMVNNGQTIKVVIPPEMEFAADSIFDAGSAYNPTNANNDINVLKKFRWNVILQPYFTSTTNWFFLPEGECMIRLVDRQARTPDMHEDPYTNGVMHKERARWVLHVENYDRIFGSNG